MKIERVKLLNALKHCAKIASKRSTMPVLSHVQIKIGPDFVSLFATNLETGVRFDLDADLDEEWKICVPAVKMADIIGAGTEREVALAYDEKNVLTIIDGKSKIKLKGLDGNEMPPEPLTGATAPLRADLFWRGVALTAPFASTDETRPVMTCVHLNRARLESTDGFRLSVAEIEDTGHDVLLPARALMDAASIFAGKDEIHLGIDGGSAIISSDNVVAFYIALVEGRFPDVDSIIPKNTAHKITFDSAQMAAAVKLAMVTAPDTAILWMDIKPDGLTLTTTSDEIGNSEVTVSGESDAAEKIGINGKFLRDALQIGGVSSLRWNGPKAPLLFRGLPGWTHVIMPMGEM